MGSGTALCGDAALGQRGADEFARVSRFLPLNEFMRVLCLIGTVFLLAVPDVGCAQARTGFAVSGGIGISRIKDRDNGDVFDDRAFGFIAGAEYRFASAFALAVDLFDLGTGEAEFGGVPTDIAVKGGDVSVRLIVPMGERFEVYGRAGLANYTADQRPGGGFALFGRDAAEFGGGLDYVASESLSLRLDARYFDGSRSELGGLLTAGLTYRF